MKGLYITSQNMTESASGVNKKIRMQVEAFKRMGFDIVIPSLSTDKQIDKLIRRLPFVRSAFEKKLYRLISDQEYMKTVNFVYIRHPMTSIQFISILKQLKRMGIYIVYEFPTFPYDKNSDKLSARISLIKDKISRNKLHKYVNLGVNYSGFNEIFSIPCINISNGVDIDFITPHKRLNNSNTLNFIGVALLAKWNGYDRLITAIRNFNSKNSCPKIKFHIVGNGDIFNELKQQINSEGLNDLVFLHGYLSGKELDDLYDQCNIGVGTLNPSRKYKNHIMSSLKTKEYTAKGIPFIKGDIDDVFDKNNPDFVFNVKDDEFPIDIENIIKWYKELIERYGEQGIVEEMREFAQAELSWDRQLYPVGLNIRKNINV